MLDLVGDLVQTNLSSNTISSCSVLSTRSVVEELVYLFKGETLEFGKDEDGKQEADDTEAHEDDVSLVANAFNHVRRNHGNSKVHLL